MDIEKIKKINTKKIGKTIEYYEKIESTHLYAKKIANEENNGKVIIAGIQTGGIGTNGRKWNTESRGKNILISIILKPKCSVDMLNGLTIDIANIIKDTIYKMYGYNLEIKKPNDLFLNGKKICGILTEVNTIAGKINYLIISFGFNVNEEMFSKEIENIATSLKKEYGKEFNIENIIINIIKQLDKKINF